jgi:hypothetical protein
MRALSHASHLSSQVFRGSSLTAGWAGLFPRRRSRRLAEIQRAWGTGFQTRVDLSRLETSTRALAPRPDSYRLDEHTRRDLNLDDVFLELDHTTSIVGRQHLYARLWNPLLTAGPLLELDRRAHHLDENAALRERIQIQLARLRSRSVEALPGLLGDALPELHHLRWIAPLLSCAAALLILLSVARPVALLALLVLCVVNLVVQHRTRARMAPLLTAVGGLPMLVSVARALSRLEDPVLEDEIRALWSALPAVKPLARLARYLALESSGELIASLYTWINMVLLLDVTVFVLLLRRLRECRREIRSIHDGIGLLDVSISVASYRAGHRDVCVPEFLHPRKEIEVISLRHPLLPAGVPNSLSLRGEGVALTGSNASGKTTFIRALALNAVLAQSLSTAVARRYRAPLLVVRSHFGRDDDLLEQRSHFQAEVEGIGAMLRASGSERQHLFVIDEIFRGTNTVERVAAAKGVLDYLNRGEHLVAVATHDPELLPLLESRWWLGHFREEIEEEALRFEYQLHPGPASTRNAIHILEMAGFPEEVIGSARATADRIDLASRQILRAADDPPTLDPIDPR